MAGPIVGALVGSSMGTATSSAIGITTNPFATLIGLNAAYANGLTPPSIELLTQLRHKGQITTADLRDKLRYMGVGNQGVLDGTAIPLTCQHQFKSLWDKVIEQSYPQPPLEGDIIRYYRGTKDWTQTYNSLRRHGFTRSEEIDRLLNVPNPVPMSLLLELRNRGRIDGRELNAQLRAHGYGREDDRQHIRNMRYHLPGISDIIRYAAREVWDLDVVREFGYDDEFPAALQYWADKQGFGWQPNEIQMNDAPHHTTRWTTAEWRAHWNMLSPSQAMVAVHQLRRGIAGDPQAGIEEIPPFTPADFSRVMKIADYPPKIRSWLLGLSFQRPGRRDMLRMRRLKVWTQSQVTEGFRDLGFASETAIALGESVEREIARSKQSRGRARLIGALRASFGEGMITESKFLRDIYRIGLDTADQVRLYEADSVAVQEETARKDPSARKELAESLHKRNVKRFRFIKTQIRKAFTKGVVDESAGVQRLVQAGMGATQAGLEVDSWKLAMVAGMKTASTAQISRWVETGSLPVKEAARRLTNLGYSKSDANIVLGLARDAIATRVARLEEQEAKSRRDVQRAIERQIQEHRREIDQAKSRLLKNASKFDVTKFLKAGLIDRDEAIVALIQRGFGPGAAELHIFAAEHKTKKTPVETTPLEDLERRAEESDDILEERDGEAQDSE